jgi:hypothetical protein
MQVLVYRHPGRGWLITWRKKLQSTFRSVGHHATVGAYDHRMVSISVLLSIGRLAIMRPPCGTPHASKSASAACSPPHLIVEPIKILISSVQMSFALSASNWNC